MIFFISNPSHHRRFVVILIVEYQNTTDADMEHDEHVMVFYEKNGFIKNNEFYNKNRKTISMRKDIYI